uniref:Death domain-containing protein n=1 Tax=Amphimedon queenslandica TaxID=400682 RepID=A0A1X7SL36_AMPQE
MAERRSPSPIPPLLPKSSVMNGKPDLKTVCAIVRTSRWHQLGIQLGVDEEMLQDILSEGSEAQDKRTQMFRTWINSQTGASHNQLVEALRLKVIGEDRMAQKYEEKVKEEASKTTDATGKRIHYCRL